MDSNHARPVLETSHRPAGDPKLAEGGELESHALLGHPLVSKQVQRPGWFTFQKLADAAGFEPARLLHHHGVQAR